VAYAREGAGVAINYFPTDESDAKEMIDQIKAEGRIDLAVPGAGQPAELGSIYVQLAAADANYATGRVYGAAGGSGQP
jgi:hypothetical protein